MPHELKGIFPATVTPFDDRGGINEDVLRKMVEFLIRGGVHGLFPGGTVGEFFSLNLAEKKRVVEVVLETAAGRLPVMPNTGGGTYQECLELTRHAAAAGADAVSLITPLHCNVIQEELYHFYRSIGEEVEIPIFIYNNPGVTGVNIKPETILRLAEDVRTIVGVKEGSGNLYVMTELIRLKPPDFLVFVGLDSLLLSGLGAGADGSVAALANLAPELYVTLYDLVREESLATARKNFQRLAPLLSDFFTAASIPVVLKHCLEEMGFAVGPCRAPLLPLSEKQLPQIHEHLQFLLGAAQA